MSKKRSNVLLLVCGRVSVDLVCFGLAYLAALLATTGEGANLGTQATVYFNYLLVFTGVWCAAAIDQRLFVSRRSEALVSLLFSVTKTFFAALMFCAFLIALFFQGGFERSFFVVFSICALLMLLVFRLTLRVGLWSLRRQGYSSRGILLVGANDRTAHLVEVFLANEHYGYHVVGFLEDDDSRRPILELYGVPWLGKIDALEDLLVNQVIDGVYISLPVRSCYESIQNVAHLCEGVGVPVRFVADLFPLRLASSELTRVADIPLLSLACEPELHTQFALRRTVDVLISLLLLVLLIPVFLMVALAIKLETKGPVFVFEEHRSSDQRRRKVLQFRTARTDKNAASGQGGPQRDLTKVGGFLRRYGLDELPQLASVLTGQMSLTGRMYPRAGRRREDSPA